MLGIPTARLNTVVWGIAALLSFFALFLKAGISGVPIGFAAGLPLLMLALAALVIGRLERLPTVAFAAIALGLLEFGALNNSDSPVLAYPIMAAAIFVVLLVQRPAVAAGQRPRPAVGVGPKRSARCRPGYWPTRSSARCAGRWWRWPSWRCCSCRASSRSVT